MSTISGRKRKGSMDRIGCICGKETKNKKSSYTQRAKYQGIFLLLIPLQVQHYDILFPSAFDFVRLTHVINH